VTAQKAIRDGEDKLKRRAGFISATDSARLFRIAHPGSMAADGETKVSVCVSP